MDWKRHRFGVVTRKTVLLDVKQASRFDRRIARQGRQQTFTRRAVAEREDGRAVVAEQMRVVPHLARFGSAQLLKSKSRESKARQGDRGEADETREQAQFGADGLL